MEHRFWLRRLQVNPQKPGKVVSGSLFEITIMSAGLYSIATDSDAPPN
jgi:hypothetical protein